MPLNVSIVTNRGHQYVRVCKSFRNAKGTPTSRIVENHGRLDELIAKDPKYVDKLRERIAQYNQLEKETKAQGQLAILNARVRQMQSMIDQPAASVKGFPKYNIGICVLRQLWKELGMHDHFRYLQKSTKMAYSYDQAVFLLMALRLLNPASKRRNFQSRQDYIINLDEIDELEMLYKVLDRLAKDKSRIIRHLNRRIHARFKRDITVALYDVTTYEFESRRVCELKNFGLSKAHKVNEVQVVLGLCIDSNGIPIDYELYPGNTSEFGTMCPMIESIRRHYCIKKMVVVADRGLNSNENLKSLLDMGCDFVIAQKIRNCPQEIQKQIFDVSRWQTTQVDMATGEITLRHLNLELSREIRETCMSAKGNRYTRSTGQFMDVNWLVTFSSSRQQKELRDIDRMVEKAEKAIAGGQLSVSSKGYRSLISIPKGKGEPRLNEEKIQEKRKWAGYYCICTNMATDSPLEIINTYRQLWQIEDCFRTSKSFLEARPCFVWTENHIRGHFVSCFISLVFEQLLKYKLKVEDQLSLSTQEILKALRDAEVVCMNDDPLNPLYIKLEMPEHFESIGKAFDLEVLHSVEDRSGLRKKLHLKQIRS